METSLMAEQVVLQDPWDDLLHDITGSICNEKCSRKNSDSLPFRELVPSQPESIPTGSSVIKRKCGFPADSLVPTSRKRLPSSSARYGHACVDAATGWTSDRSLPMPAASTGMDYVFVCSACYAEFSSSAALRRHKPFCQVISKVPVTSSESMGCLPSKHDSSLLNSSACRSQSVAVYDYVQATTADVTDVRISQASFMASIGLQCISKTNLTPASQTIPLLTLPPPLVDFGSPARQSPPPLTPQPRTPRSLISQLLRSPSAKSPRQVCAFPTALANGCSDESSCSDDDGRVECQVRLIDVMKSPMKVTNIHARAGSPTEVAVVPTAPDLLPPAAAATSQIMPPASGSASPATFPRWILGIDLSSPLGMRVMASFGNETSRDGAGTSASSNYTAGTISSKGYATELLKLRERDVLYPVAYKQPRRQKHVHIYQFRNRNGRALSHRFASQPVACHGLLSKSIDGSESQPQACAVCIPLDAPSATCSSKMFKECSVRIGKLEREAADNHLWNHGVKHGLGELQNSSVFPSVSRHRCGRPKSRQFSDEFEQPLSVQVSEEVYAELMVLRDVLKKTCVP